MSETVCHDCGATEGSFSRRDGGPWYCAKCHWFHEAMKADGLRAALSQSLDVNAAWDHWYREAAIVLDAAREWDGTCTDPECPADGSYHVVGCDADPPPRVKRIRALIAALPPPPVERGRAALHDAGRSLEWGREGT